MVLLPQYTSSLSIFNSSGQLVWKTESSFQSVMNINLSEDGLYFAIANTNETTYTRKIIVCR